MFAQTMLTLAIMCAAYADSLKKMNVKFMLRGYCRAGSNIADEQALGGFETSDNFPKRLTDEVKARAGQVTLVALAGEPVPFAKEYRGMRLLLVNGTQETVAFRAQDSRLPIIQEARDTQGNWKPVEYLPSSWCGNSYHRVMLGPSEYWEFVAPQYVGAIKTTLRFVLQGEPLLYSNEFEGSVNAEQFSAKQRHSPTNLMDPYLD